MSDIDAGITIHIDEQTTHTAREEFRDELLGMEGVLAAAFNEKKPHLLIVIYNPALVRSSNFISAASNRGLHAELIA